MFAKICNINKVKFITPYLKFMRQIKNISFKKDEIILAIDEEKFIIDKNIFAEHYLYLGKQISDEEYDVIKNEVSLIEIRKKYLKKLLKKRLSKQEVINLLKNEKLNIDQINNLIMFFENNYLLNDKTLEKELYEELELKNASYQEIKNTFSERGLNLNKNYDSEIEYHKILFWINSKKKLFERCSFQEQKQKLNLLLLRKGFPSELINRALNEQLIYDEDNERAVLTKEVIAYSLRNDLSNKETKDKFINKLIRKGYRYHDIIKTIGDLDLYGQDD